MINSKYIDKRLYDEVKNYKNKYVYNFNNNHLEIYTKNKITPHQKELVNKIIYRINSIKNISNNISRSNFYIYLSPLKKYLPNKYEIISPYNVNSAVTNIYFDKKCNKFLTKEGNTCNSQNGDIYICREEEVLKVLLHEMIHSLNYDHDIKYYEAYTETLATILNILYYMMENNIHYNNKNFYRMIDQERKHTKNQINKILHHYGYKEYSELFNKKLPEKTHVYEYYILKGILLNDFIEKYKNKNGCVNKYINEYFIDNISNFDNNLNELIMNFNMKVVNNVNDKSMKMCIYG